MFRKKLIAKNLTQSLVRGVDSYDNADGPGQIIAPQKTVLSAQQGNPAFNAQFDLQVRQNYFTVAGGVWTSKTAAQAAAASVNLTEARPAFIFGNSDFSSGFAKLRSQFPLVNWTYQTPFVVGKNPAQVYIPGVGVVDLDATALGVLANGDLVIPYTQAIAGPVYWVAFTVIRCTQVAYGTLLDALNSDMFTMNMVRYIVPDSTAASLAQYNNNIFIQKLSLFGKFDSDFVSPNSMKMPDQQQDNIIDVPIVKGVDKQIALAVSVNYDVTPVQWSLFVAFVNKLAY